MATLVEFATEGVRRRPDSGLYYYSACGQYALYNSDQLYGMPIQDPIWLAIEFTGFTFGRVLGRRRSREGAAKLCRRHARAARVRKVEPEPQKQRRGRKRAQASPGAEIKPETTTPTTQRSLF